ncbi:MAG: PKD domain-containing protein [Gammaproteobacteria bacterium]|nr:PKD domain-containing protein [Gammaproteobacteria bacterium]
MTFTFADPGEHAVELTVTDNLGIKDTLSRIISVNDPPRAAFRIEPDPAETLHPVTFDASVSMDADGMISGYRWLIAGNEYTEPNPSVTFTEPGEQAVELTVTDNLGAENTLSRTITVNDPPQAAFRRFNLTETSHTVTFDAYASMDADGTISSYRWFIAGNELAGKWVTVTFADAGDYTVELTVTDNLGTEDTLSRIISVNDPPQAAFRMVPDPAETLRPAMFDASASIDPDGTISDYRWSVAGNALAGENMTFTFEASGQHAVELTVTDNLGAEDTLKRFISVNDPPLAAFRIEPDPGETLHPVTFDASASYDPNGAISSYHWSIAGNVLTGENVTFTFDEPGEYTVELEVMDDLGSRGSLSSSLSMLPESPGRAILIAGGEMWEKDSLSAYSNDFVQRMYRLLLQRGFSDEDILYMNPHPPDIDLDGYPELERQDFDFFDSSVLFDGHETDLKAAFAEVAEYLRPGQQFILYAHSHARFAYLDIRPSYKLSIPHLRELLDSLPSAMGQIVILDSCYSGYFATELAAPGRIVISSTDDSSQVWNTEHLSFSDKFINALRRGESLGLAFDFARQELQNAVRFAGQVPWLEDDGDGLPNIGDGQAADGLYANGIYLGRETPVSSNPPEIIQVHPRAALDGTGAAAVLWVKTSPSADAIRGVRAILLSPNVRAREYKGRKTVFARLETELVYNPALDRYESEYTAFCTDGDWEIWYQAQDNTGAWSEMKSGHLVQAPGVSDPVCDTGMSVKVLVNRARYTAGDLFRMMLETDGAGEAIPYAGVILPDGNYFTYRYNTGFGLVNTPEPFLPLLPVNGKHAWPVMEVTLPQNPGRGHYRFCAVLVRVNAEDVPDTKNWLDWDCVTREVYQNGKTYEYK